MTDSRCAATAGRSLPRKLAVAQLPKLGIGHRLPGELDLAERQEYPIGTATTAGSGPYTAGSVFSIAYGKEFDAASGPIAPSPSSDG